MIKISGLWIHTSAKGEKYFTGDAGSFRVVIMKNTYKKEGSNEPDYTLYFDEKKKKAEATTADADPLADDGDVVQ